MRFLLLVLPILLVSGDFKEMISKIDSNTLLKSQQEKTKSLESLEKAAKAKDSLRVDLLVDAIRLKDEPTVTFSLIPNTPASTFPMGTKSNLSAELRFSYPLFTGYLIGANIEKSKLEVIKSKLQSKNLKRKLYSQAIELYGKLYSINGAIKANKDALNAVEKSYKKAKAMYKNGLLNMAEVYNIEAKKFNLLSKEKELSYSKKRVKNLIYYLCNYKIDDNIRLTLPKTKDQNSTIKEALKQREDIKAIKNSLKINDQDIKAVKSKYYPKIALIGGIKKVGDNLKFNGDGHRNADESYVGISFRWNLFDGSEKSYQKEALLKKKIATTLYLLDYEKLIATNIKNNFLELNSLKYRQKALLSELKSKQEYFKLVKGKFENALSSADELSRAIANLSQTKAKLKEIEAKIFIIKQKILLQISIEDFENE